MRSSGGWSRPSSRLAPVHSASSCVGLIHHLLALGRDRGLSVKELSSGALGGLQSTGSRSSASCPVVSSTYCPNHYLFFPGFADLETLPDFLKGSLATLIAISEIAEAPLAPPVRGRSFAVGGTSTTRVSLSAVGGTVGEERLPPFGLGVGAFDRDGAVEAPERAVEAPLEALEAGVYFTVPEGPLLLTYFLPSNVNEAFPLF